MKKLALKGGAEVDVQHTSKQFTIGWKDGLKSLLIAGGTPVLIAIQETVSKGTLALDYKQLATIGIGAGIVYLIKNFLTPAQVVIKKAKLDEAK